MILTVIDSKVIGIAFFLSAALLVAFCPLVVGASFLEATFTFIVVAVAML